MKSNSYKIATALWGCRVRFEERAREFIFVARLINGAVAKASLKWALVTEIRPDAR